MAVTRALDAWRRLALVAVGLLVFACAPSKAGDLAVPGCLDGGDAAQVASVETGLLLRLVDGREVVLPGLDIVRSTSERPAADEDARAKVAVWLVGHPVRIRPLRPEPDRWGRTVALVFAGDPSADQPVSTAFVSVGEALLEAGLARMRPEPLAAACTSAYLAIEADARRARTGLWSDPYYAPLAADDSDGHQRHLGTLTLIEGRLAAVARGRARSYLRLSTGGSRGFAATVLNSLADRWAKAGADPALWVGKRLRVRGYLDDRFGTQIELSSPGQVEIVDPQ